MNNNQQSTIWVITIQPNDNSASKCAYTPKDGRLFCSNDEHEMAAAALKLNAMNEGFTFFVEPQS
jgi:hypothetical protein